MKRIALLVVLACAGFASLTAIASTPNHGCDPHKCRFIDTGSPASTATVTVTTPAAPTQKVTSTQTVTVPAPSQTQSQTQTVVVVEHGVKVITRTRTVVKVKKLRRYCTRQRHGWRCGPKPPHSH